MLKMDKLKLGLVGISRKYVEQGETIEIESLKKTYNKYLYVKNKFEMTYESKIGNKDIYNVFVVCAIVNVTKDFNPFDEENTIYVYSDTDSYQIRPKLIYKDKKGLFYKPYGSVVRLTDEEVLMVEEFINKNKD